MLNLYCGALGHGPSYLIRFYIDRTRFLTFVKLCSLQIIHATHQQVSFPAQQIIIVDLCVNLW